MGKSYIKTMRKSRLTQSTRENMEKDSTEKAKTLGKIGKKEETHKSAFTCCISFGVNALLYLLFY